MRTRWPAVLALAVVLALKLLVLASLGGHPLLQPVGELDGAYYRYFAERVAGGDPWLAASDSFFGQAPPPFFMSPLYVYALALVIALGGTLDAVRVVQVLLGTAAVALIGLTARRWYGTLAGWLAGTLAALCGLFTFFEILILQAALEPFLAALDLYLLTRAVQDRSPRWWAAAGAVLGLHVLNRPNLFVVLIGITVLVMSSAFIRPQRDADSRGTTGPGRWRPVRSGLLLLAAAMVVISPATIRNWRVSGELVLVSSHGGYNFLVGNGPSSNGTFTNLPGLEPSITGQWLGAVDIVRRARGHEPSAVEVSDFFYDRAWQWIRQHPDEELALLARKSWYALSAVYLTLNHSFPFFAEDVGGPVAWLAVGPWLIVPLGLVGLIAARPVARPGYWLWAAYVPLAVLSLVVFFVAARYRIPYQVALTVTAGGGAAWAIERGRRASVASRIATAAAVALLLALVNWPTGLDDGRAEEQVRMGLRQIEAGRTADGEVWIGRAVARHALPGAVHVRAGQAYEVSGAFTDALRHYDEALTIDPDEPSVHFVRGRALYYLDRLAEARAELERAREGPQADAAGRLLALTAIRAGDDAAADSLVAGLRTDDWGADEARQYAEALVGLGRADLSIAAWTRAAAVSGRAEDYERLGLALAVSGQPDEAVAAFREGVVRDGRSASLRLNLAVMLAETGAIDEAKREAAEALRLDPDYERAKALLAALSGR